MLSSKRWSAFRWYDSYIVGYVVMPDHVRLLVSEPERRSLAVALQMLKQVSSRKLYDRRRHTSHSPSRGGCRDRHTPSAHFRSSGSLKTTERTDRPFLHTFEEVNTKYLLSSSPLFSLISARPM